MKNEKININQSDRGNYGEFIDRNGIPCSIQKSSISDEDLLWLGVDNSQPHDIHYRMCLTRNNVTMLLPLLQQFTKTGELPLNDNKPIKDNYPCGTSFSSKKCGTDCPECNNGLSIEKDWDEFNDINPASTDNNRNTNTPKQYLNTKNWDQVFGNYKIINISKPKNKLPSKNADLFTIVCDKLGKILEDFGCDSKFIDAHNHIVNDLGLDSLDCVELAMALEDEFDIIIPDEDAEKLFIIKNIVNYILKRTVHKDQVGLMVAPGYLIGYWNRLDGKPALYISGDENGADSNQHKEYIAGYIKGYNN